jgi:hypothetical protein
MQLTQDDIAQAMDATLSKLLAPVAEIEVLRRKEFLTEEEAAKLFSMPPRLSRPRGVAAEDQATSRMVDGFSIPGSRCRHTWKANASKTNEQP